LAVLSAYKEKPDRVLESDLAQSAQPTQSQLKLSLQIG
jgi:hypothetical protein